MGTPVAALPKTFNFNFAKANPSAKALFQPPQHGCSSPLKNSVVVGTIEEDDDDDMFEDVQQSPAKVSSSVVASAVDAPAPNSFVAASAELSLTITTATTTTSRKTATTPRSSRKSSLKPVVIPVQQQPTTTPSTTTETPKTHQQQPIPTTVEYPSLPKPFSHYDVSMMPDNNKFTFTAAAQTPPPVSHAVTGKRVRGSSSLNNSISTPAALGVAKKYDETPARAEGGIKKRMRVSGPSDDEEGQVEPFCKKKSVAAVVVVDKKVAVAGLETLKEKIHDGIIVGNVAAAAEQWSETSESSRDVSPPTKRNYIAIGGDEEEEDDELVQQREPVGSWLFSGIKRFGQTIGILEL
ncbi:UNVERIFIED_CONTAM: hypothetical protein HDU68_001887 [Siphonaria sp. JEL0065]|nr:hypothetical protein HDU68_001887 [Siphonaria sp. JEL0065]